MTGKRVAGNASGERAALPCAPGRRGLWLNLAACAVLVTGLVPLGSGIAEAEEQVDIDPSAVQIDASCETYCITESGTYQIGNQEADELGGIRTIQISLADSAHDVIIEGAHPISYNSDVSSESWATITSPANSIHVDATGVDGVNLTIRNLYNHVVFDNTANVLDFSGTGNVLNFEGFNVLEYDYGYTEQGDAHIHVGSDTELAINTAEGSCTYIYTHTQGATIGGETGQMNGNISFGGSGSLFVKGTAQAAVVGAGTNAVGTGSPGSVSFDGTGSYYFVTNARGAAIGGANGSSGNSPGTEVTVSGGVTISLNTDYSGACIGGGGNGTGNFSDGGTLYYSGGSIRPYVDHNSAANVGAGWLGRSLTEGVNDAAITAQCVDPDGNQLYFVAVPTNGDAGTLHSLSIDGSEVFTGSLHTYHYVYDGVNREAVGGGRDPSVNVYPNSAIGNWVESVDTFLYVFMTGEDHTLCVDGVEYTAKFSLESLEAGGSAFALKRADIADYTLGDVNDNGRLNIVDAQIVLDLACGCYGEDYSGLLEMLAEAGTQWNTATVQAAADMNGNGAVEALDARAIQVRALDQ